VSVVDQLIEPRRRSIGSDEVDRLLPFRTRRTLGPFVYADLIGPSALPAGVGVDVPVHPHIGLATVTSLFEGALVHRDSTGAVQRIEPGAVNWMTAGRGVAHSERSPDDERAAASRIHGLQTWVALPDDAEQVEPSFQHIPIGAVPEFLHGDARVHLVAGTFAGVTSPVRVASPTVHAVLDLGLGVEGGATTIDVEHHERGVLVVSGQVSVGAAADGTGGDAAEVDGIPERHLAVLRPGVEVTLLADGPARVVLLGGAPIGPRLIRWNFVSSSQERIDAAATAWRAGDWPAVPGDDERIPMP
jgi:redox-sensitive bicupin YhaK (pirin superfamily)